MTLREGEMIAIRAEGYGTMTESKDHGYPIMAEVQNGKLLLYVWPDINLEDYQLINLEGAKEE